MDDSKGCLAKSILKTCVSQLEMIMGTALTAMAFGLFILPQNFAAAGVTGFASIIYDYLPLSLPQMVFAVNMLFFVLGLVFVGKTFTVKTVASSLLFPLFLQVFSGNEVPSVQSPMVSVLIAGTLLGAGTALILRSGASAGGFSVLGVILQNKWNCPIAVTLNVVDSAIILMQFFRQSLRQTVYGILVITLSAFLVGQIVSAEKSTPRTSRRWMEFPHRIERQQVPMNREI